MMNKSTGLFAAGAIALVAMGSSALKCNKHIAGDDYYIDYADDKVHEVNDLLNSICERSDVHLSFFDYMDCREEFDHVGDFVEYCGTIVREQRDTNGDVVFVNGEVVYERVQQDVCVTAMFEATIDGETRTFTMADGCGISSDAIEVYNSAEDEWNAATTGNNYDTVRKTLCNGDSYQSYWRMMSPYSYNGSDADQYPINDNTVVTIKAECCSEDFCNEESTGAASLASAAMAALIAVVAAVASF